MVAGSDQRSARRDMITVLRLFDFNLADLVQSLGEGLPKVVAQLVGVPDWSATLDLRRAEIALRRGDYVGAEKDV